MADVVQGSRPNTINRKNVRRRIIIQCNTAGRDLNGVVLDIQKRLAPIQAALPTGYFLEYGGQFESQRQATRMIGILSLVSLAGRERVAAMLMTALTAGRSARRSPISSSIRRSSGASEEQGREGNDGGWP